MEFEKLDEDEKHRYYELSRKLLDGQLYCTRVWDAWHYNTMSENDFNNSEDDDDLVYNNATLIYQFLQSRFREMKINDYLNEN